MGHLINRRTRELSKDDIRLIANTYHSWKRSHSLPTGNLPKGQRGENSLPLGEMPQGQRGYKDIKGFCASVSIEKAAELDYVLTPGRYVGLPEEDDDFDFNERFTSLKAEFENQLKEEAQLNERIVNNLAKIELKNE